MKPTVFNTWEDIKKDIELIFGEKTRDYKKDVMACFKQIFDELEGNSSPYLNNDEEFQHYINKNENLLQGFYYWMPYLSGERASLLRVKLYNANYELLNPEKISEEERENAYMVIAVNQKTLQKFINNRVLH